MEHNLSLLAESFALLQRRKSWQIEEFQTEKTTNTVG